MSEWRGGSRGWCSGEGMALSGSTPKALTPGGFDAIFPRREPTCEELVNNICPSSGRLTPRPPFHTLTYTLFCCQSRPQPGRFGQACSGWTGRARVPLQAFLEIPVTVNQYCLRRRFSPSPHACSQPSKYVDR